MAIMKALTRVGLAAVAVLASSGAVADNNFGLGVKAGTLGAGIEGTWRPLPYIDIRVGTNVYDFDDSSTQAGIDYDATLSLDTVYATGNFRFPLSPFRVTAGVFSNSNELLMTSSETGTFELGGNTYNASDVGTLTSTTSFGSTAPYLGFGYDFSLFNKVGLNFDIGVLWQGEPEVAVTADGILATNPGFIQSLETERLELQNEISDYKAWPVVSLGFVYNF
jgi:hypothetical protein